MKYYGLFVQRTIMFSLWLYLQVVAVRLHPMLHWILKYSNTQMSKLSSIFGSIQRRDVGTSFWHFRRKITRSELCKFYSVKYQKITTAYSRLCWCESNLRMCCMTVIKAIHHKGLCILWHALIVYWNKLQGIRENKFNIR